jgi:soluble lytic murein transglycosylase-like protein
VIHLNPSPRAVSTAILLAAGLALFPGSARADVAMLKSGRSIEVLGFRLTGDRVELSLPGGGQIALPAGEVLEIRRQPLAEPPAPAAGPAATVAAASAVEATAPALPDDAKSTILAPAEPGAAAPAAAPVAAAPEPDLLPKGATDRQSLRQMAARIAQRHGVAEPLVHAVIEVESRYNPRAVSRAGAMGLMQLMPKTADRFSVVDAFDPVQNVDAGVRYLKELLERYSGQVRLALAAYNAGEEAVERHGGIPPYRETINYVKRVQRAAAR